MIKDFRNGEERESVGYEVVFDDGRYNGYSFPCDEEGNPKIAEDNDAAKENYEYCVANPDKFARYGKVIKRIWTWRENNSGTCDCGNRIELINQYLGGCECPYCGRWWNVWGQELNNPSTWSEGEDW